MRPICLTLVLLYFVGLFSACEKNEIEPDHNEETIEVSLKVGEAYKKSLGNFGFEEGATIDEQAAHYSKSEVYRGSESSEIFYEYVPAEGYTGKDEVVISKYTGDIGDGKSGTYSYLKLLFTISE